MNGVIKFYSATKGFGFIELAARDEDVFFHIKQIQNLHRNEVPKLGAVVELEIGRDKNGRTRAQNILLI